ncbi:MAG TPA: AraC family transcriptional regulator [Capsulimonadaceae bacterium]|jgi:AraC-like DNA-binding protein
MTQVKCVFSYLLDLPPNYRCHEHDHDCVELVICEGCAGSLVQDGADYDYADGSVFVYQPGVRHWVHNVTPGRQVALGVLGAGAETLQPGVWSSSPEVRRLFAEIRCVISGDSPYKQDRLDLLSGLIVLDLRELTPEQPRGAESYAAKVKEIIDRSFATELDVAKLARQVYVSPDYLRQVFRREFGTPVIHYLIGRRIDHARLLLSGTDTAVVAIAEECGFNDSHYFSRMFKKATGQSPIAYRESSRGK